MAPSQPSPTSAPAELRRIALAEPDLRGREGEYLQRCVADNWVSSAGPYVAEFERKVAEAAGSGHGVAVMNGTAALSLALTAAGIKPGDHVIVPDYTFAATANAVIHIGAVPCFVDVTPDTWTLDSDLVSEMIARKSPNISAVIPVHTLGHPAEMDRLRSACDVAGVIVIEDAAGAIGANYRGRPAGSLGHAAIFSFNGNKTVTAGGGGMIVTDRRDWAERAKSVSQQARSGSRYQYEAAGFNYRLTNVNAAIGVAQMERLCEMLGAKREIAARYDRALAGRNDLRPMPRAPWAESGCWLYSVLCGSREAADALVAGLTARNIEARHFWESLSPQSPYRDMPRLLSGIAAGLSGRVVSLPCSSQLPAADQERVIEALAAWRGHALEDAA